jgi:hypothetical protein
VETQKEEFTETALLTAYCYNNATKHRSYYGVPFTQAAMTNHVWRSLVEKAGYQMADIPKTARGDQLERRRRQQRLPFQADRHGSRRLDLDRGRDHRQPGGI